MKFESFQGKVLLHPALRRAVGEGSASLSFAIGIANFQQIEWAFGVEAGRIALASLLDRVLTSLSRGGVASPDGGCGVEVHVWDAVAANLPETPSDRREWLESLIFDLTLNPIEAGQGSFHLDLALRPPGEALPCSGGYPIALFPETAEPSDPGNACQSYRADMALVSPAMAALGGFRSAAGPGIDVDVCWQPVRHAMAPGDAAFFEALLATIDVNGRVEPGGQIIAAAERLGFVRLFDRSLVSRVVDELIASSGAVGLAVSVAAESLADTKFWEKSLDRLALGGGVASDLIVEIRGGSKAGELSGVGETLSRLRQAGCRISIGNFGLGATSLQDLAVFAPEMVTVDRHFFSAGAKRRLANAVPHLVALARTLGAEVVADGVDDAEADAAATEAGASMRKGAWCGAPRLSRSWIRGRSVALSADETS